MFQTLGSPSRNIGALETLSKTQMVREHCTVYKTNGTGRDTYIYNNNGGFSIMHQPQSY